jgi:hypothetical protein
MIMKFNKQQLRYINPLAQKWILALESGDYTQTKEILCDGVGFCCLGVACEVGEPKKIIEDGLVSYEFRGDLEGGELPLTYVGELGLNNGCGRPNDNFIDVESSLVYLNDEEGLSFKQIAKRLRATPEAYFQLIEEIQ